MDRTRLALVSVVVLAVTGGALAATTFESAGFSGGDDATSDSGSTPATGGGGNLFQEVTGTVVVGLLVGLVVWIVVVLALAIREGAIGPRAAFVIVVAIVAVGALALTYSAESESAALDQLEGPAANDSADGEPLREQGTVQGPPSTAPTGTILALLAGLALVGGISVIVFTRSDASGPGPDPAPDETDAEAVARVAGETADRIEETTLSNAVYRAWLDMTDALEVPGPETTTPADFADHAIAAGIDERDARALTDLFREVRYGDAEVTPRREEQARELLRRIESSYADGADAADADSDADADGDTDANSEADADSDADEDVDTNPDSGGDGAA